jgi:hypothetical protein
LISDELKKGSGIAGALLKLRAQLPQTRSRAFSAKQLPSMIAM